MRSRSFSIPDPDKARAVRLTKHIFLFYFVGLLLVMGGQYFIIFLGGACFHMGLLIHFYLSNEKGISFFARLFSISLSIIFVGCGLGVYFYREELIPPALQTREGIHLMRALAHPEGIDLTGPDALPKLRRGKTIADLREENGNWSTFKLVIPASDQRYETLERMAVPGVGHGFPLNRRQFDGVFLIGREFYFGTDYEECDSWLFSKRPLAGASFVMNLLDRPTSSQITSNGMVVLFQRVLGPHWNDHVLLSKGRL